MTVIGSRSGDSHKSRSFHIRHRVGSQLHLPAGGTGRALRPGPGPPALQWPTTVVAAVAGLGVTRRQKPLAQSPGEQSDDHTYIHTHICHTHSLTHSHTHTVTPLCSPAPCLTHSHTFTRMFIHTVMFTHILSHIQTLIHCHTFTCTDTFTHAFFNTHVHTHACSAHTSSPAAAQTRAPCPVGVWERGLQGRRLRGEPGRRAPWQPRNPPSAVAGASTAGWGSRGLQSHRRT